MQLLIVYVAFVVAADLVAIQIGLVFDRVMPSLKSADCARNVLCRVWIDVAAGGLCHRALADVEGRSKTDAIVSPASDRIPQSPYLRLEFRRAP